MLTKSAVAVALLAYMLVATASARVAVHTSIEDMVQHSDAVLYVSIEAAEKQRVHGNYCGTRYTAKIRKKFKGGALETAAAEINFGRDDGLEIGSEYILFLRNIPDIETLSRRLTNDAAAKLKGPSPDPAALEFVKCNGLFPGLEYDIFSVWDVLDADRVMITGLLPRQWPNSIYEFIGSSTGLHYVSRGDLFSYLEKIHD